MTYSEEKYDSKNEYLSTKKVLPLRSLKWKISQEQKKIKM